MALRTKKTFVILLMAQTAIILLYAITTNLPTNVIRWRSVTIDGLHTPQHNFTDNGNNLLSVRITMPKSAEVSSKNSVTDQNDAIKRAHLDDLKTREIFQQIDDKQAWIYSAFFDHVAAQQGRPSVRIFCIVHRDLLHTVYCNFTTLDGNLITNAPVKYIYRTNHAMYTSNIVCDLPANTRPTHVSISFQKNKTATNRLQITYPGTLIRNFTVCYSILHSNFNSASQLIQSIEMNRILGAEHFVLYNYSVSPAVDHIVDYQQDGLLTVLPWPIPTKQSWYFSQVTALIDCFYRNRNISRFIVVVDTDEFIIPKNHSNWMELIAAVSPEEYDVSTFVHSTNPHKKALAQTGCFIVRCRYFSTNSKTNWRQLPSHFSFSEEEKNNTLKHNILTLSQFLRASTMIPPNYRTKYIARPDLTYTAEVHNVKTFVNVSSCLAVSSDASLVHHYKTLDSRNTKKYLFNVTDTSMLRFKRQLYARVMERYKQFPHIFT